MQNKLFKKSSVERFTSPEKLNDYIQVSNPSSWMVLVAALAVLLGMLIWGFFGELTESVSFSGLAREDKLVCYVNSAISGSLQEGMEVAIAPLAGGDTKTVKGKVSYIAPYPLSYAEASVGLEQDYLLAALGISTWNIVVDVMPEEPLFDGMVYSLSAVIDTQRPIDLVFQ